MAIDLRKAEELCRQVAPRDLCNTTLYVVATSTLPEQFPVGASCLGFTSGALDLYLRRHVAWKGRGPAMLVNDGMLEEERDPESWLASIALHELAHILDRLHETGSLYGDPITESPVAIEADRMFRTLVAPSNPRLPRTFGHEANWIRIALHLRYRSIRLGTFVPIGQLFAGDYGIDPVFYTKGLGSEIADKADWPIQEILRTDPRQEFTDLWHYDIAYNLPGRKNHDGS